MITINTQNYEHENVQLSPADDIHFEHFYDQGRLVSGHWHNDIEIIYLLKGDLDVVIEKNMIHYKQDDLILINSKVIHATVSKEPNESILIQIPYSFLTRYIPDIDTFQFYIDNFSTDRVMQTKILQLKETLQQMLVVIEYHPEGEKLRFTALLFELLYLLYHNFKTMDHQVGFQHQRKDLSKLDPVLEYTKAHYQEPITLKEIADVAGFQSEYFCRLFKKIMGTTYLEYLNEIRLSHIYYDLITTNQPIHLLLEKHGFTNYNLFRKMFFERFQTTPLHLRKENLEKETKPLL